MFAGLVLSLSLATTGCDPGDRAAFSEASSKGKALLAPEDEQGFGSDSATSAFVEPVVHRITTRYYDVNRADWDPSPTPNQLILGTSNMIEILGRGLSLGGCAQGGPGPDEIAISIERDGYPIASLPAIYIEMAGCTFDGALELEWAVGVLGQGASTVASGPAELIITNAMGARSLPFDITLAYSPFEVSEPGFNGIDPAIDPGFDGDGDGFVGNGPGLEDCDDDNPNIHPLAEEDLNERDDDCDGAIDEGFFGTECGDGICDPDEDPTTCPSDCGSAGDCSTHQSCPEGMFCDFFECTEDDCFIDEAGEVRCEEFCFGECRHEDNPDTPCDLDELIGVGECMSECGTDFGCMFDCSADRIREDCLMCTEAPISNLEEFCGESCNDGDASDPTCRACLCETGLLDELMGCAGMPADCGGPFDEDMDGDGFSESAGDCDDANDSVHPGAPEQLNGMDDNCNGLVDENVGGVPCNVFDMMNLHNGISECGAENALECANGPISEDCAACTHSPLSVIGLICHEECVDSHIDDPTCRACVCNHGLLDQLMGCAGMAADCGGPFDEDMDGDGASESEGDCDDTNPEIFPGADERPNGMDDNCNSLIDEGFVTCTDHSQCGTGICEFFQCSEADCFEDAEGDFHCEDFCVGTCVFEDPPPTNCMTETTNILDECLANCMEEPFFARPFCMNSCTHGFIGEIECAPCATNFGFDVAFNCGDECGVDLDGDGVFFGEEDCQSCLCATGLMTDIAECTGSESPCGTSVIDGCEVMECIEGHDCIDGECVPMNSCESLDGTVSFEGEGCNDFDFCTVDDICQDGECRGEFLEGMECGPNMMCLDGTCMDVPVDFCFADHDCPGGPCVDNQCVFIGGCPGLDGSFSFDGDACNDFNPCTVGDVCFDGECQGEPVNCDDGSDCTEDFCDPLLGECRNEPSADCGPFGCVPSCEDSECGDDGCGGICGVCAAGETCVQADDMAFCELIDVECDHAGNCDLDHACIDDECVFAAMAACATQNDCAHEVPCLDAQPGAGAGGVCGCFEDGHCPSGHLCLGNQCVELAGCHSFNGQIVPEGASCDDGTACTVDDVCVDGECAGQEIQCGPNQFCHSNDGEATCLDLPTPPDVIMATCQDAAMDLMEACLIECGNDAFCMHQCASQMVFVDGIGHCEFPDGGCLAVVGVHMAMQCGGECGDQTDHCESCLCETGLLNDVAACIGSESPCGGVTPPPECISNNDCPAGTVCDADGTCVEISADDCSNVDGTISGHNSPCDDGNDCTEGDFCFHGHCSGEFVCPVPGDEDVDQDGVVDGDDNCPTKANAEQSDLDADGEGDACDGDIDGDGVSNEDDAFPMDASKHTASNVVVDLDRELMITDLSVVEDPTRTASGCFPNFEDENPNGVWTFKHLVESMAGEQDPTEFVENWLTDWATRTEINGFEVIPAESMETLVLAPWRDRGEGILDLDFAPFRLLSIVNRFDLRNDGPAGTSGEGRFVFGLLDAGCNPTSAVIIFEYALPGGTDTDVADWASHWHSLGELEGAAYNDALELVTRGFTDPNAMPERPNGSAINQVRTNDVIFTGRWTLREFRLDDAGDLVSVPTHGTPDASLNGSAAALFDTLFEGAPVPETVYAAEAPVEFDWTFGPDVDSDTRHTFAVNTCNGCHGNETGTPFMHVSNRQMGQPTQLSGFLTGTEVSDPFTGELRSFDDLGRRRADLEAFLAANQLPTP